MLALGLAAVSLVFGLLALWAFFGGSTAPPTEEEPALLLRGRGHTLVQFPRVPDLRRRPPLRPTRPVLH